MIFDMPITCNIDDGRAVNYCTGNSYTTAREIWSKSPKAAARKATAPGVNHLAIKVVNGSFRIYQISGYTPEKGLYCDLLNEKGQVVKTY